MIERGFVVVARTMYNKFACMLVYGLCRYRRVVHGYLPKF
jgi:hypothetical protein